MIVGSVTGVGAAKGRAKVPWGTMRQVAIAWVFTLPGSALVGALAFWVFG